MRRVAQFLLAVAFFVIFTLPSYAQSSDAPQPQQAPVASTTAPPATPGTTLEDGTPVKLRISQTISSADAHVGQTVDFEVLEEIKVGTLLSGEKCVKWA